MPGAEQLGYDYWYPTAPDTPFSVTLSRRLERLVAYPDTALTLQMLSQGRIDFLEVACISFYAFYSRKKVSDN